MMVAQLVPRQEPSQTHVLLAHCLQLGLEGLVTAATPQRVFIAGNGVVAAARTAVSGGHCIRGDGGGGGGDGGDDGDGGVGLVFIGDL